jgi:hypothetical protein
MPSFKSAIVCSSSASSPAAKAAATAAATDPAVVRWDTDLSVMALM